MVMVPWAVPGQVSQTASNDRTGVLSRLQPERRISGWPASGQGKRPLGAAVEPRRGRWQGRVPWTRRRSAAFVHPHTPHADRATGLLDPAARNRSRFIEITIRFQQNRPDIHRSGNGPFLFERRVPGRKSVIAVADCGFPSRLPWRVPMQPFTAIGIRQRQGGDVLDAVPGAGGAVAGAALVTRGRARSARPLPGAG
jgi:hypothetical protein